ncbi:PRD domain-containing protein [Rathayibacter sp. VKM Ac-2927]|uniref:PRD domain-containing protein n=1 Tax=Rathayibacter sp. VKM Ac-2927 TaxID=2929478 RepID=UPI001FB50971|nr:PRD domain-containing protein [Rathayibacter sp. VKM Ac-2927]MCJ1688651.1 PRD domain-containing protein [Rathayibacter sp. VKM Ac-2927]
MTTDSVASGLPRIVAHKVLNNNVVISIDRSGRERVLMGRGLGFQVKVDDIVDQSRVEKTFVLEKGSGGQHARQLLADVSYRVVEATNAAIDEGERMLGRDLGPRFAVALLDHVQFVLERLEQGVRIPAAAMPELRVLHPGEFTAAQRMTESISARLQTALPPEEAVFITMHLLNATRDEPNGTAALLFRRVQHVVATVEAGLGVELDRSSPEFARFILHVQFLLQRLVSKAMLRGADTSFFEFAKHSYSASYEIATKVKFYVSAATGSDLTDEEMLYVIVHVERLASRFRADDGSGPVL